MCRRSARTGAAHAARLMDLLMNCIFTRTCIMVENIIFMAFGVVCRGAERRRLNRYLMGVQCQPRADVC